MFSYKSTPYFTLQYCHLILPFLWRAAYFLKIQINYRKQNDQNKKYASNDVILQIIYHSNRCFYDKQKPFSEFLFYFESVIIFEGRLHVSTTWICNGICLYVLIMTKRMSALVALILIPITFALIGGFYADMGPMMLEGIQKLAPTGIMLMFAILYFGIMIDSGLFDPVISRILKFVKGDP